MEQTTHFSSFRACLEYWKRHSHKWNCIWSNLCLYIYTQFGPKIVKRIRWHNSMKNHSKKLWLRESHTERYSWTQIHSHTRQHHKLICCGTIYFTRSIYIGNTIGIQIEFEKYTPISPKTQQIHWQVPM